MNRHHIEALDATIGNVTLSDVYDIRIDDAGQYLEIMSERCRQVVVRLESPTELQLVWDSNEAGAVLVLESLSTRAPMAFLNSRLFTFPSIDVAHHYADDFYPLSADTLQTRGRLLGHLPCVASRHNRLPRCIYDDTTSTVLLVGTIQLEGGINPYQFLGFVLFDLNGGQIRSAYQLYSDRTDGADHFVIHRLVGPGRSMIGITHVVEEHDLYVVDMENGHTRFLSSAFSNEGGALAVAPLKPKGAVIMPSNSFHGNLRDPTLFAEGIDLGCGMPLTGLPTLDLCSTSDITFAEVIDRFMYDGCFAEADGLSLVSWNCDFGMLVFDLAAILEEHALILKGVFSFRRRVLGVAGWGNWVVVATDDDGLHLKSYRIADLARCESGTVKQFGSRYKVRCDRDCP